MDSNVQQASEIKEQKPLRLWPGVVIVLLQWIFRFLVPAAFPGDEILMFGVLFGMLCGLAVAVWWAFFSRAAKSERWGAILFIIAVMVITSLFLDISIATSNMGMMFIIYSIPVMSLAFVAWAVITRRLSNKLRRLTMVLTVLLASGMWLLLRTNGMTSDLHNDFAWRWAETEEDKFLAESGNEQMTLPGAVNTKASWPGFRGAERDSIVRGVKIKTDWKISPPAELWRRQIGPGCSSFAVNGGFIYTQEQRGEKESVTCYNLSNGKPVWIHGDKARFWDSHAGAGPRGTPTISGARLYTFGATGILNVLNAANGNVIWSRNVQSDSGVKISGWGFASSPLVTDTLVIVATAGKLAAYDKNSGKPRWFSPDGNKGYSSPHLLTLAGVPQVLLMSDAGVSSFAPADGKLLWKHEWQMQDRVLQPALTADGSILLSGGLNGMRSISVTHDKAGWSSKEQWTSTGLSPNFNDFIVHKGYAYGFSGINLSCIDLKDGKRKWKDGRYGGEILLLSDQDLILVLTEKGELALVSASPDKLTELARVPAIKGKTWNHPVLAGDLLLVRNTTEMAAFRLPMEKQQKKGE